jgi:precorrin-6B methylase 1
MPSGDLQIYPTSTPRRVDWNGFSVREDVLYTDAKGRDKSKLRKRAKEAFDDLDVVLRRVLEPNETIFYIAPAQVMPGALAQFLAAGGIRTRCRAPS